MQESALDSVLATWTALCYCSSFYSFLTAIASIVRLILQAKYSIADMRMGKRANFQDRDKKVEKVSVIGKEEERSLSCLPNKNA
jgi:hypothetical protein